MAQTGFPKITAKAQERVNEPVLAAAYFFAMEGFAQNARVGGLLPVLDFRTVKDRSEAAEPASGLPTQMALAITDNDVLVLPVKAGLTTKIRPPVDTWPRSGMRVTVEKTKVTYNVRFDLSDGRSVLTETKRLALNKPVADILRLLGASVPD